MAIKMKLFIASVCFMAFIFTRVNSGDISRWCNQTPNPEPCKFHMSHGPWKSPYIASATSSSMSRTQFRDMAIQVAMSHALEALDHTKSLGPKWQSGSERAVWTNCVHLYDNTVFQLKKSLLSYVKPTPSDIQTWLSASLTNLHTCQSSFLGMNASKNLTQVMDDGVIAYHITFQNTAGPDNGQAVAFLSSSDCSVFYHCGFEGYQDTLFVYSQRQFYQNSDIYGTVDFIFGNAAVVLQNCNIYARKPLPGGGIVVTAQARHDLNQTMGISILNSRVIAAQELVPVVGQYKAYLGRPWDRYSRVVYMETFLDSLVDPAGWLQWDDPTALSTLYYGEYRNSGPGSLI